MKIEINKVLVLWCICFLAACSQRQESPAAKHDKVSSDIELRNLQLKKVRQAIIANDKAYISSVCDYESLTRHNDIWFLMERENQCAHSMQYGFTQRVLDDYYEHFFPPEVSSTLASINMDDFDKSGFAQSDTSVINSDELCYTIIKSPSATEISILVNYNYQDSESNLTESTVAYLFRLNDKSKLTLHAITIAG